MHNPQLDHVVLPLRHRVMRRKPVAVPEDHRLQEVQGAGGRQDLRLQEDQDAAESGETVKCTLLSE